MKRDNFLNSIKVNIEENNSLLKIQKMLDDNVISIENLTEIQKDELIQLYKVQINKKRNILEKMFSKIIKIESNIS